MGTIKALCISEKKGTLKTPVHKALFQTEWGMVGDAHAGRWHRQVSFLGLAEIEAFRKLRSREIMIAYRRRVGEVKLSSWRDGWYNFSFLLISRRERSRASVRAMFELAEHL